MFYDFWRKKNLNCEAMCETCYINSNWHQSQPSWKIRLKSHRCTNSIRIFLNSFKSDSNSTEEKKITSIRYHITEQVHWNGWNRKLMTDCISHSIIVCNYRRWKDGRKTQSIISLQTYWARDEWDAVRTAISIKIHCNWPDPGQRQTTTVVIYMRGRKKKRPRTQYC